MLTAFSIKLITGGLSVVFFCVVSMRYFPTFYPWRKSFFRKMLHEMLHGHKIGMKTVEKRYEKRATTFIVTLCFFLLSGGERGI